MNILLVSDVYLPTVSGVASSTDSIAKFLSGKGHAVYLVCPKPDNPPHDTVPNLTIVYTPSFPDPLFVGKRMNLFPFGMKEIIKTIREHHIDIAHIQEPATLGLMGLLCCKLTHTPVVGAMHFSFEQIRLLIHPLIRFLVMPLTSLSIKILYPQYDAIMTPTQTFVTFLQHMIGTRIPIHAVSNGVDTKKYTPTINIAVSKSKLNLTPNTVVMTYIGRLDKDKNIQTIFRALSKVDTHVKFAVAGVGKEEEYLRTLAKNLHVEEKIIWVGKLNQDQMVAWYQASDFFVITSPVETQSIVTLQAVACGIPIIAARSGALPELVRDGQNGYLIDPYDVETLTNRINTLAADSELRIRFGKESRAVALPHDKPVALSALIALYTEVLTRKKVETDKGKAIRSSVVQ